MAITEPATRRVDESVPTAPARRGLISRMSMGHVVMILAGLVAILLNLAFLRSTSETIQVLVAGEQLPAGTVLTASAIDLVEVGDAAELADGLITAAGAEAAYGSLLARPVAEGEPIRRSDLRPDGTTSNLREYALELDAAQAAGGRIADKDIVDVIATVSGRSYYVAVTIEVVAVNQESSTLDVGDDLILVLSVDDATALEIAAAESVGSISVVRSTGAEPPATGPVTVLPAP